MLRFRTSGAPTATVSWMTTSPSAGNGRDPLPPSEDLLSLNEVAEIRGVHYMTVYRHVRTGRLPAVKISGEWKVRRADASTLRQPPQGIPGHADLAGRLDPFQQRLSAADEPGAWAILEGCLASGANPVDLHHELIVPVMRRIGDQWNHGQIDVADEHTATSVMQRLVGRLGPLMRTKGRSRGTIIIGAVTGDPHALATAIVADILRNAHFTVLDLGGDTPPESFAETVEIADQPKAVGLSVSAPADGAVRTTIAAIRTADPRLPILVGGRAIADLDHAIELGADGTAAESRAVVPAFERLIAQAANDATTT